MNSTLEFTLKEGLKVEINFFWEIKSWRNFFEGLKRKIDMLLILSNKRAWLETALKEDVIRIMLKLVSLKNTSKKKVKRP